MAAKKDFTFNLRPLMVPKVRTKYRKIRTSIPASSSLKILEKISKYESSNIVNQPPIVWSKSKGFQFWDVSGNCWIDLSSTIFVTNSGHGNRKIVKAINSASKRLLHSYSYPTEQRAEFLEKLITMTPKYLEKASLYSAGTEATERVIKLIRLYGKTISPNKKIIVAWDGNYHGKTMGAQLLSGSNKDKEWIGYSDPGIVHLPFPFPWEMQDNSANGAKLFESHLKILQSRNIDLGDIAGFVAETFQGWGAIFFPTHYIKALRDWSKNNKSLLAFDEIQAGFGRTGKLFGYEHYGVEPDLVACGKAISGSLPLSAVLGSAEIIDLDPTYTSTHGGHPIVCAAGLANLKEIERMDLISSSRVLGDLMNQILLTWQDKFPGRIGMIFGKGLLFAVFILKENYTNQLDTDIETCDKIVEKCLQRGVFLIRTGRGTLKFGPPLVITRGALLEALTVVEQVLSECFTA